MARDLLHPGGINMTRLSKETVRSRKDTYLADDGKLHCVVCGIDLLYHEVHWWSVTDSIESGAVFLNNNDHDDGVFTCECRMVVWNLSVGL
jgi:hypothetical protein